VIGGALAAMLISIVVNVLDRTFAWPLPDLSEVAIACMSVLAFIGGAHAVRESQHISIELGDMLPHGPGARATVRIAIDGATVAFSVLLIVYAWSFLEYVLQMGERTPELDLPVALPVSCLIVGSSLSIFHVTCRWVQHLPRRGAGRYTSGTQK
jgi:TRAP-type C4-dicarboxylate transport system permease small subunit